MKNNKSDFWVKNPTKKHVVIASLIWLVGLILILVSTTNYFTENPVQRKYLGVGLVFSMATFYVVLCLFELL
jgi:uncharacterized PurR-regulated membrane protein YhhQ (DUF165 family)